MKKILFFALVLLSGCVKSQPRKIVANTRVKSPIAFLSTHDLTFSNNTDISNANQIFTASGGSFGFGHTGVDDLNVPAGQEGRIYYKVSDASAYNNILAFDTVYANNGWANFLVGVDVNSSLEYFEFQQGFGSFFASGYTLSPPQWIGIYRAGASFKTQVSNDGKEWTDLNIYRGSYNWYSSDTIYARLDMHTISRLDSPRIDIYSPDKRSKLYVGAGNSIAHGALPSSVLSESDMNQQGWYALDGSSEWFFNDVAVNGQSIDAALTAFPTTVKPLLVSGFSKIIISYLEGTNQLSAGGTAAAAFLKLKEYIDTCLVQRPEVNVMVYMTPSCNPAVGFTNATRNAFNDSIATLPTTYGSRVKIVDIRGDAILDGALSYSNTTYFWDGTHMTQVGYDYYASLGAAVLVTFGYGKYVFIFLLLAAAATKAESKIVSINKRRKAA